jgi:hypothetical protein
MRGIGISAKNAQKTHCTRGHELSSKTYTRGERRCLVCERINNKKTNMGKIF